MNYTVFHDLQIKDCQHPLDRQSLTTLEKTPGLSMVLNKINEYGIDRLLRIRITGNCFRVTPRNFPDLYEIFIDCCQILDYHPAPDLYVRRGKGHIETYSAGVDRPIIVLNLETIEWLSERELLFLLGGEISRIKGGYLKYQQLAYVMDLLKSVISSTTLGFGSIAANGIEVALYNWIIMGNFTADRVGLLTCQDVNSAITALIKLGGLPEQHLTPLTIREFCTQAREFNLEDLDRLDKVAKVFSFMEYDYPWMVMRASEMLKWVDDGVFDSWMHWGNPQPQPQPQPQRQIEPMGYDRRREEPERR